MIHALVNSFDLKQRMISAIDRLEERFIKTDRNSARIIGIKMSEKKSDDESNDLFDKICTKAFEDSHDLDYILSLHDIQYGNVANNYNPAMSLTKVQSASLRVENEYQEKQNQEQLAAFSLISTFKTSKDDQSKTPSRVDIRQLNLVRKNSVFILIEKYRINHINCPFDEIAQIKISNKNLNLIKSNVYDYHFENNFLNVNINNLTNLLTNEPILPNCISEFFMPFFFDIFKPSELKLFGPKTINIIMEIKRMYKPRVYLDTFRLEDFCICENILWNSFALFNYTFNNEKYLIGFLNYIYSIFCLVKHFDLSKIESSYSKGITKMLPNLVKACIITGHFNIQDLKKVLRINPSQRGDLAQFEEFLVTLELIFKENSPMKLGQLSRIVLKSILALQILNRLSILIYQMN